MKPAAYIALDLATKCGFAVGGGGERLKVLHSGTWNLKPGTHQSAGVRALKLIAHLDDMHSRYRIAAVSVEEVHRHAGNVAAHIFGGLLMTVQAWCAERSITVTSFGVGQIKQHWTGKGNASKGRMKLVAEARGFDVVDDNHADALALLDLTVHTYGLPEKMLADTGIAVPP